jgi:hypothetical protein
LIEVKQLPICHETKKIGHIISRGIIPPFSEKQHNTPKKSTKTCCHTSFWTDFLGNVDERKNQDRRDKIYNSQRKTWEFSQDRIVYIINSKYSFASNTVCLPSEKSTEITNNTSKNTRNNNNIHDVITIFLVFSFEKKQEYSQKSNYRTTETEIKIRHEKKTQNRKFERKS